VSPESTTDGAPASPPPFTGEGQGGGARRQNEDAPSPPLPHKRAQAGREQIPRAAWPHESNRLNAPHERFPRSSGVSIMSSGGPVMDRRSHSALERWPQKGSLLVHCVGTLRTGKRDMNANRKIPDTESRMGCADGTRHSGSSAAHAGQARHIHMSRAEFLGLVAGWSGGLALVLFISALVRYVG
jgi:hypothetical protein